ncbi:MAG: FAD-binding oxidoreductase [Ignavibacteriae bacterium]|nr:FAD-binding oxidoreductase [Ignavibacteriota bacterium]
MKNTTNVDYLIVGQGIAGSTLAWELLKCNKKILVIDNHHKDSSSIAAGGNVNPVTGKRFVKSWHIEDLLLAANSMYTEMEKEFGVQIWEPRSNVRILHSEEQEKDWLARAVLWDKFFGNSLDKLLLKSIFSNAAGASEITGGGRVNMQLILKKIAGILSEKNILWSIKFDYNRFSIKQDSIEYRNGNEIICAHRIIFCEGWQAIHNPYFNYLPFQLSKGEALIVRFLGEYPFAHSIVNNDLTVSQIAEDHFWVGATNVFNDISTKPTKIGLDELLNRLELSVKIPFEIIEHRACVRPTIKDKLPLLGVHPNFAAMYIFNGLGTKGASLAPMLSRQLVNNLESNIPLNSECSIARFELC